MAILEPIFNETVWTPLWAAEADAHGSSTETGAADQGTAIETPALRPPENPFRQLLKKIDELSTSDSIYDIRNALYMVHGALDDKQYSSDQEHFVLSDRWLELTERLNAHQTMQEPQPTHQPLQRFAM